MIGKTLGLGDDFTQISQICADFIIDQLSFLNNKDSSEFKLFIRAMSSVAFYQKVNNGYRAELIKKCHTVLSSIDEELRK